MNKQSGREKNLAKLILPHLLGKSLLDLGSGDGKLIEEIHNHWPGKIILADIVKQTSLSLPFYLWDGRKLPFADKSFDNILLAFVLHYCQNPLRVLREAKRVARTRIIILEDTPENFKEKIILKAVVRWRHWGQKAPSPKWFLSAKEWQGLFEKTGLKIVSSHQFRSKINHALFGLRP